MFLGSNSGRMPGLDWLRVLLSVYLVVFHTLPSYPGLHDWAYQLASAGYVSTSLFFVLSGFVLAHVYLNAEGRLKVPPARFLRTRFAMLYPIHVVGFMLAGLGLIAQFAGSGTLTAIADIPPALRSTTTQNELVTLSGAEAAFNVVAQLLLVQAWNPLYQAFNVPAWSISALAFFYLCFVSFAEPVSRTNRPVLWMGVLVGLYLLPPVYFILQGDFRPVVTGFLHTNPLVRLPEFLAGVLLCKHLRGLKPLTARSKNPLMVALLAFLAIVLVIVGLTPLGPSGFYLLHNGALLPAQLVLVAAMASMHYELSPTADRWLRVVANSTLTIFILHLPLFSMLTRVEKWIAAGLPGLGPETLTWAEFWMSVKAPRLMIEAYPLSIGIVLAISVAVHYGFVLRFRDFLTRHKARAQK